MPSTKADRGIFLEVDDFSQNFVTMCSVVNLHITNFCLTVGLKLSRIAQVIFDKNIKIFRQRKFINNLIHIK